jgi:F-type H+-transporting ATPase subunit b
MKQMTFKHIGLLALLVTLMLSAVGVMAQDATPAPGGEGTEASAEGAEEAAAEGAEGTEAEPAVSPLTPLGINLGFLIAQIINFGVVFGLLSVFMWGRLRNMLDTRAAEIAKGLEDAKAAANARLNAEAEAEKILAQARQEVAKNIEEGRSRGAEVGKQVEADARAQAEKILADARASAAQARDAELAGMRGQVAAIAIAATQRLIGEALDEKKQHALVNDFFSKVPKDAKSLGGKVEVVSAMPLTDDEKSKVQKETGASDVSFSVDPSILGGLILRAGDRIVDGSVRSNLSELSSRLN